MKKYKLKKEYPGCSLVLGDEVEFDEKKCTPQYICKAKGVGVAGVDVSRYPEFWEEVVEKDYEVLTWNVSMVDNSKNTEIKKVKYLPTGEIFTVNDDAKSNNRSKSPHKIRSFEVRRRTYKRNSNSQFLFFPKDEIWVNWEEGCGGNWLCNIEHYKKPIFTTEDGVDIFKGMDYYTVYTMEDTKGGVYRTWEVTGPFKATGLKSHYVFENVKYFSREETAEEYMLLNKPCLSLKDFQDAWLSIGFCNFDQQEKIADIRESLEKKVKGRL